MSKLLKSFSKIFHPEYSTIKLEKKRSKNPAEMKKIIRSELLDLAGLFASRLSFLHAIEYDPFTKRAFIKWFNTIGKNPDTLTSEGEDFAMAASTNKNHENILNDVFALVTKYISSR